MDDFFQANVKDPASQYSVRVPSMNGLSYNSSQEIIIYIDPSVRVFDPLETYLKFRVKINSAMKTKLYLDPKMGGQCLIRDVNIRSGTGVLLEELFSYNQFVHLKYSYDNRACLKNKRVLLEGSTDTSDRNKPPLNGTGGSYLTSLYGNDVFNSAWGDDEEAELCLPLHTGIFSNDKIFPNHLTDGLYIHMLLETDQNCIRQNPKVVNPEFALKFLCDGTQDPTTGGAGWPQTNSTSDFFIQCNVNLNTADLNNFPFQKGEKFAFFEAASPHDIIVNNPVRTFEIDEFDIDGDFIKITISGADYQPGDAGAEVPSGSLLLSVESAQAGAVAPKYQITQADLIVGAIEPPDSFYNSIQSRLLDPETGLITYDFESVQTYSQTVLASNTAGTLLMPLNNTMCKSLLCKAHDTAQLDWKEALNNNFYKGVYDKLLQYQFFYKNTYQPDRPVRTSVIMDNAVAQQQLIELEKALYMADISPENFNEFKDNFVIGRAVALNKQIADLNNTDVQLNVNYDNTASINKLFRIFVAHIRAIEFRSGGISIQV
tara:strand:+ start:51 stop:1682 length:1632 start_codon:yes stop_codon:yes gene_type:complete